MQLILFIGALLGVLQYAQAGKATIAPLRDYGLLQCGVCELMSMEIGRRMNITADKWKHASYLKTHRIAERQPAARRESYQSSELQATEVLELLCQDIRKGALFRQHKKTHARLIIGAGSPLEEETDKPILYSATEAVQLAHVDALAADFCEAVLEDYEDVLVRAIKRHTKLDKLMQSMCVYGLKVCDQDVLEEAQREEQRRWDAYAKRHSPSPPQTPDL